MRLPARRRHSRSAREEEEPALITTIQAAPDGLSTASFDRAYWLSHCEGFRADTAERLVGERNDGRAVLLVSLAIEEIQSLSDRILVLYEGRIVGEYPPTVSKEELGIAMTGGRPIASEATLERLDVLA